MGHIHIRTNGFGKRQMIVGGCLGLIVGLLAYYVFITPDVSRYGDHHRSDAAATAGVATMLLTAALIDVIDRIISALFREHGAAAIVAPSAGGHIWYVPMWITGGLIGFAIAFK